MLDPPSLKTTFFPSFGIFNLSSTDPRAPSSPRDLFPTGVLLRISTNARRRIPVAATKAITFFAAGKKLEGAARRVYRRCYREYIEFPFFVSSFILARADSGRCRGRMVRDVNTEEAAFYIRTYVQDGPFERGRSNVFSNHVIVEKKSIFCLT